MNTPLITKIAPEYLKRLTRDNFILTFFTGLFILGSLYALYSHPGGGQMSQDFAYVIYAISAFIGAGWTLQTCYRGSRGPVSLTQRYRIAWLLICLGLCSDGTGSLYCWYLGHTGNMSSSLYTDLFFLLSYPLFFISFLLLPTQVRFRMSMAIDAIITTCSIAGISWYFVIGPHYFQSTIDATSFANITNLTVNLSYPILNMIALLTLFLLVQGKIETNFRLPYLLLMLGQISFLWANTAYAYLSVIQVYQIGTVYVDIFWFVGVLLCGLASLFHYTALVREVSQEQVGEKSEVSKESSSGSKPGVRSWQAAGISIYIPFVTLLILCGYAQIFHKNAVSNSLVLVTLGVSIIVAARYLLATRENEFLLQEREQQGLDAENLRLLVMRLNQILDMDRLLERTISLIIEELGFTAALLLLPAKKEREGFPVQIFANSRLAPMNSWYSTDNALLQSIVQEGKEIELSWEQDLHEAPPEMQHWLQQQQLTATYFLPLRHQNRVIGSLGIAHKQARSVDQRSLTLTRAYCEQVATIIEHARLYQEAREHEIFANAMTTIAVRLNTAVVEAAEIGRLICQEGARALHANYVLLYLVNEQEILEPYALSVNETQKESGLKNLQELKTLHEVKKWPRIEPQESAAQALHAPEPFLHAIPLPALVESRFTAPETPFNTSSKLAVVSGNTPQHITLLEKLRSLRVHTILLTPLILREKPAGIVIFARSEFGEMNEYPPFDTADIPRAQGFAEQAGVAFTNARLYQRLKTAHQRLKELDQLKDQFMITASHELRTPLTAIQGYVELLTNFGKELTSEQQQEFLQKARQSCEELAILLSNIMDASRLEVEMELHPLYTSRIQVDEIIKSTLIIIEPQITQEQREVHLHLVNNLVVMADPVRLRQILMNISANALKYSDPRTPISFFARASSEPGQVVISITDKGKGIAPEEQVHIFERFYRLESDINSAVRGSGLGLYVSKRLVEVMGGKIWIESRGVEGEGSTFHIQLPMA